MTRTQEDSLISCLRPFLTAPQARKILQANNSATKPIFTVEDVAAIIMTVQRKKEDELKQFFSEEFWRRYCDLSESLRQQYGITSQRRSDQGEDEGAAADVFC